MSQILLSQSELAKRWGISPRTLERWRWQREGLKFVKIGGLVRYRLGDVEDYEAKNINETEPKP